jgi:hypothetical protein
VTRVMDRPSASLSDLRAFVTAHRNTSAGMLRDYAEDGNDDMVQRFTGEVAAYDDVLGLIDREMEG